MRLSFVESDKRMKEFVSLFGAPVIVLVFGLFIEYCLILPWQKSYETKLGAKEDISPTKQPTGKITNKFSKALAWIIIGKADEKSLSSFLFGVIELLFSVIRWSIIGSLIGIGFVAFTWVISVAVNSSISGTEEAIKSYGILGATIGAVLRILVWPIVIGVSEFIHSRKNKNAFLELGELGEHSLLMYPYIKPPYNAIEMRYVGNELLKDLKIWLVYNDNTGIEQRKRITEFFPKDDYDMFWRQFTANTMEEDEVVRFRLVRKESTIDGKVKLDVHFEGAKTGKTVEFSTEFELEL